MGLIEGATRAALVGAVLAAIGTGATAARADDPVAAALPSFASPPAADRSGNWSGSSADAAGASTLLDALKQAGFGSAQLSYTPTAAGRAALTQVLEHAAQLGLDVNLAPCGNTSCDSSAVTLITRDAGARDAQPGRHLAGRQHRLQRRDPGRRDARQPDAGRGHRREGRQRHHARPRHRRRPHRARSAPAS